MILGRCCRRARGRILHGKRAMKAGLPQEKTAWGMNQLCGSGLRAVALGMQQIATGDAKVIVAGEWSRCPWRRIARTCARREMGDYKMIDTMIKDGLTDAFYGYHMGITAGERCAKMAATRENRTNSRLPPRTKAEAAPEGRAFCRRDRAFRREDAQGRRNRGSGRVHSPRCHARFDRKAPPGLRQGRYRDRGQCFGSQPTAPAAALLMTEAEAARRGIQPLARIVSWATAGVDPQIMGTGPSPHPAGPRKSRWSVADIEPWKRRGFRAQACAVNQDSAGSFDRHVNGGAIAIGHPIGASGARVLNTLSFRNEAARRLQGLHPCIGGGMGGRHVRGTPVTGRLQCGQVSDQTMEISGPARRAAGVCFCEFESTEREASMSRVALVTGGSRGIGAAICVALKAAGYKVAANYAGNDEEGQGLRAGKRHSRLQMGRIELSGLRRWHRQGRGGPRTGRHPASTMPASPVTPCSTDDAGTVGEVIAQSHGVFNMTHPVWSGMRDRGFGRIVNISSINGRRGRWAGELFRRQGRRSRPDQGAGPGRGGEGDHRQRDLPRLYRHRDGCAPFRKRCSTSGSFRRYRWDAWASRRKWHAASCFSLRRRGASSPAPTISANGGQYFA